jgi:squalene-hopene/tetraprenyl-beta-curcumene cyclase
MRIMKIVAVAVVFCTLNVGHAHAQMAGDHGVPDSLREALHRGLDRAQSYLLENLTPDGSWESNPGISALAATAILQKAGTSPDQQVPRVRTTLDYLAGLSKPDGGIYVRDVPHYVTAVSIVALANSGSSKYESVIGKARDYLAEQVVDEGEGYNVEDKFYGGIGYGSDLRPDMSNLEMGMRALKEAALPDDHEIWDKAIRFIERTQNFSETNDQEWAADDGGFVYYPGFTYAESGGTASYGSMTYAGLLSYSYANVTKDDDRVQAALRWIRENYTVDENPGMSQKTVYYYYLVFAKALQTFGDDTIVDSDGRSHNWREDLGRKLMELQYPEGYWVNATDPDYMQDNKVLVTAFTMMAINHLLGN